TLSFTPSENIPIIVNRNHRPTNMRLDKYLAVLLVCLTAAISLSQTSTRTQTDKAFQKLQSLAGEWLGQDEHGNKVKSSFAPVASATALMETLAMPGMDEMVTLYSVDMDSVVLTHYCPTNNQPRMRAMPPAGSIKELVFEFSGAGNLPDVAVGHEHRLVLYFEDQDHITERWTWRKDRKDTEMVFHLRRIAPVSK
ncbi:MAG: hypothetical protein ACRD3Q_06895, partial [Terriglobales bacterium]